MTAGKIVLTIFVHRASQLLTDHASHGDGLICFSLLNGLAQRGHRIFAFTDLAMIKSSHPNLIVREHGATSRLSALRSWEQSRRADEWFAELSKTEHFDLVWRMHPYGSACPRAPATRDLPLIVGPIFYNWPGEVKLPFLKLARWLQPFAKRGWNRTLNSAAMILCATDEMRSVFPDNRTETLPVIIDPPEINRESYAGLRLIFVGNLVPNKRPEVFVEIVAMLRASGTIIGDGPLRATIERLIEQKKLGDSIRMTGTIENEKVFDELGRADFLVSASIGEPYGRAIAEAMSVGTPAACHRSGGPAEFIEDGLDGILVDRAHADAFAQRIARAPANLSSAAKQSARAWRSDVVLPRLESLLISACANRK